MPFLEVTAPAGVADPEMKAALEFHSDRYAWSGGDLARTVVRFGWSAVIQIKMRRRALELPPESFPGYCYSRFHGA